MREIEEGMLGPTEGEIRGEMMTIEDNIDDAASSLRGACAPFRGERPNFSECSCTFFKTLTIKVGGWNDIDEFCTHVLDNEIPILEVLRSIAAAGICTLVFESTSLDFQLSGSPLLDQYRRHLLLRDGPALLRDLDFVAHKSLISHANFLNQIIPGKAKEIGNQVVEVLLPIIDSSTSHSGTEAPGVSPGAAKPLDPEDDGDVSPIEAFQGAIENALKLRAQMALNGLKQYEFVYIPPETYFNPQTMNLNGQNYDSEALVSLSRYQFLRPAQMSQRTPSGLGQKVKLCLFPALYSRRRPQFDPARSTEVDIGEILVQVRVFTEGRPDQDSEGDDLKLVTKAVVLV
ncbi:hypothetical protein NKR23_g10870 [Pleurostoma richardsiae]|uniref:Uncharacterized protein n=1 Tax=Pleurostoma richardsiae TaxID=41990 RepID=A0AA38RJ21_9PEZI|nr:hypothetical protein NKR23_g10870 [Pleurostoma richardsiae]